MRAWIVLAVLLVAGCVENEQPDEKGQSSKDALPEGALESTPDLQTHNALDPNKTLPVEGAFAKMRARLAVTGFNSGEPTIGVTSDGTIWVTAGGNNIGRSTDKGVTWERISDTVTDPKVNLDPWLWVDPWTDRIFNAPLYVACTWMQFSDDGGNSWLANPIAGCGLPAHDHQKLTSGPPAPGTTTLGYPNVVYYSYNSFRGEGTWISPSLDGGMTWLPGGVVHPSDCHAGVAGGVAVGPDGTAYHAKPACNGVNLAVSKDSGMSWSINGRVDKAGIQNALAVNPDTAIDLANNAYVVYAGADNRLYLTRSLDGGSTWSDPFQVSPPDVHSTVFSVVTAGIDGHIAIGYLGTTNSTEAWTGPDPEDADDNTVWHAYMTVSTDASNATPTFVTQRLTPLDDPVQYGCVWQSGGGNACRNMLDFIDLVQHDGRPYLVFADGCPAECDMAGNSRGRAVTVAILEEGPNLMGGELDPLLDVVAAVAS